DVCSIKQRFDRRSRQFTRLSADIGIPLCTMTTSQRLTDQHPCIGLDHVETFLVRIYCYRLGELQALIIDMIDTIAAGTTTTNNDDAGRLQEVSFFAFLRKYPFSFADRQVIEEFFNIRSAMRWCIHPIVFCESPPDSGCLWRIVDKRLHT